jgi:class 3 adenylate cyclase/predicted small secreted protein
MISIRKSIAAKIGLLVLGSTCLVLALVLERSYINSRDLIRQEAETSARHQVKSLASEIEQEFLVVATAVQSLASFLETGTWDQETLLKHMQRMVRTNAKIFGSAVAFKPFTFKPDVERYAPYVFKDQGGIKHEQLDSDSYDYLDKPWFTRPEKLKKPVWSKPYFDEGGGNILMTTYSCPMFGNSADRAGPGLRAVVTGDMSLAQLNDMINGIKIYETGFCFVVSQKGEMITARDPQRIMRVSLLDLARKFDPARGLKLARNMISAESGFTDIGPAFTGVDSYVAFDRIHPPGWTLGAVLPKKELFVKVGALHRKIVILALAGIVLLVLAAILVARSISRPLRKMAGEAARVADGDLDIDLSEIRSIDEVGQLARAFTRMTEGLKDRDRIKDTFGRYLTQEVVKRLLDSKDGLRLGGETREISIIMSDLRGFTALTSTMSPEQVIKFLNRYLGKMVEIILDKRGIVDEIIGDGILAFFGAPEALENHPELAVSCALNMQIAMQEINAENEADGLPHLEMGVAVNTGEVVVGNIGSEKRAKYGAVGSQVNFTGRLESFTVGGQVLISQGTYDLLSDILDVRDILEVAMKGVPGKVKLYDIRGIRGQHEAHLEDRDETPIELSTGIEVEVFGMDQKILQDTGTRATITHVSLTSGTMLFEDTIAQWEDLRMIPLDAEGKPVSGEMYAKVVSVSDHGSKCKAQVRFTSVSSGAYAMIRKVIGAAGSPDRAEA